MEVKFALYRDMVSNRVLANNAMIALLAGARLASHTLQLAAGSQQMLPAIFPAVPDIDRFNLMPSNAQLLLSQADTHLAAVTVPYALSIQEDFVMATIEMVRTRGTRVRHVSGNKLGPSNMHESLFRAVGFTPPTSSYLEAFHILREMRNSSIHSGGVANPRLNGFLAAVSPDTERLWQRVALQPSSRALNAGRVEFTIGHIFLAFAVIKELAREVNSAIASHWTQAEWADLIIVDHVLNTSKLRNSEQWKRALIGFARVNYGAIGLTEVTLEASARRSGAWTKATW